MVDEEKEKEERSVEGEEVKVSEENPEKIEKKVVKKDSKEKKGSFKDSIGPTLTDKARDNPWVVATLVLGVVVAIFIIGDLSGGVTGAAVGVMNSDDVGQKIVNLINERTQENAELLSVEEEAGLYRVDFSTSQGESSVYVTLDGENIINGLIPLQTLENADTTNTNINTNTPTEVPTSDKPKVELFVMSICPFGTQAEKGLLPVLQNLGDKIDFSLKFVSYAMHGKDEVDENTVQYCIQKEQEDKFYDYLKCYLEEQDPSHWKDCRAQVGVDEANLQSCISKTDNEFEITKLFNDRSTYRGNYPQYNVDKKDNTMYGVQGSPTLVVNGVVVSSARDSASYLNTICGAFNTAPEECNTQMLSTSPAPGFGWDTTASGEDYYNVQCS